MKEPKVYISTDSCSVEADTIREALEEVGAPSKVRTRKQFVRWLCKVGGYGSMHVNGVIVARVSEHGCFLPK